MVVLQYLFSLGNSGGLSPPVGTLYWQFGQSGSTHLRGGDHTCPPGIFQKCTPLPYVVWTRTSYETSFAALSVPAGLFLVCRCHSRSVPKASPACFFSVPLPSHWGNEPITSSLPSDRQFELARCQTVSAEPQNTHTQPQEHMYKCIQAQNHILIRFKSQSLHKLDTKWQKTTF